VRGIVHELSVQHPGQTVTPGETLAEVIPIDVGLVAELRLPTTEVGHIHAEQPVRIAIDGLEPHRHGYLRGIVDRVSPSTFIDEDALPYYRVMISLDANELDSVPLVPGMTVQAQIKTGQRTMLEYLLKPIFRAWDTSFRER
jgi:HlyD family secretion protein/adhesin transport system membrane fusion protein